MQAMRTLSDVSIHYYIYIVIIIPYVPLIVKKKRTFGICNNLITLSI